MVVDALPRTLAVRAACVRGCQCSLWRDTCAPVPVHPAFPGHASGRLHLRRREGDAGAPTHGVLCGVWRVVRGVCWVPDDGAKTKYFAHTTDAVAEREREPRAFAAVV